MGNGESNPENKEAPSPSETPPSQDPSKTTQDLGRTAVQGAQQDES